jgi:hypothetical protein
MTQRGGWGRSRGPRHCGKRRTSPRGYAVVCDRVADGSHTRHHGRERSGWGVVGRYYEWGSEAKAPLEQVWNHAPREVSEDRSGDYHCGICHEPVERFSAPRARWMHVTPREG